MHPNHTPSEARQENEDIKTSAFLRAQNEQLKEQLMNTSLINELTRVLHSRGDLESIIKTVLFAIQEIAGFDRAILFEIDTDGFSLSPRAWVGIEGFSAGDFSIPLGFNGGEITDSLFLNRHIIVDEPDEARDRFFTYFHSESYVVIPLIGRVSKRCWEAKSCAQTSCPAHGGYNPYCWSIIGAGLQAGAATEDEKRKACVACAGFKACGVFWTDRNVKKRAITSDDITMLTTIVNLAGIIIENFRTLNALDTANTMLLRTNEQLKVVNHDLQIAQGRIRSDLDHAHTVQLGLLPLDIDKNTIFSVAARYCSAEAVGGDYYDLFETAPGLYSLVVADVSGHGIASALIMSMVKILLKTFAPLERSPQKTLDRINKAFLSDIRTDNFVTIFYAIIDTKERRVRFTSAGHCPVLVLNRKDTSCTLIKADGLFLGIFPDMMLEESSLAYEPGIHRIVLYTDGLIEAKATASDEMYGIDRLAAIATATLSHAARRSVDEILQDQNRFCGAAHKVEDDITLLIIDL